MQIEIAIPLGTSTVTVRGDSVADTIDAAAFYQELPTACPVCRAPVVFTARHPQSFHYYGLRCTGRPTHESTFGVHKEGGSLFYKANEPWKLWQLGGTAEPEPEPTRREEPRPGVKTPGDDPRMPSEPVGEVAITWTAATNGDRAE